MGINEKHLLSSHPRLDIQDWDQSEIPDWLQKILAAFRPNEERV